MALLLLLSLSSLLVLMNIEPFTAVGIFLIICFLPGLCFFYLGRKEEITFNDLLLVFPCSVGISGLLTLGTLFAGIHVKYVPAVICVMAGLIVVFCLVSKRNGKAGPVLALTRREGFFILFASLTALIMSVPYFIGPNRGFVAAHAYHHSSFVSQILNGIFPPENPGLGGTTIGYYWGFHAIVAAIAAQTDLHQLQIIFVLNAISLFIVFCMTYSFAGAYDLPEGYRYIMPFAITGLIRPDIGLYFISKLISGTLIPLKNIMSASDLSPMEVFGKWLNDLPWYDTRLFFLNKFYNISAMPTAICLCFAYLLMLLFNLKNKAVDKVHSAGLYIVIAACILIYPPLAIVPLLHAPIWSLYIFISNRGNFRERTGESLTVLIPYIMGILTVLPYLLYIMASRHISSSGQGGVFSLAIYSQSVKNLIVFLIPSPLIIYGIRLAFRRLAFSREFYFLFIGTLLCLALSLFTRWPFDNSYKYNYILIIFFAMFFVYALADWISFLSNRLLARFSLTAVIMLLLLTPIIVEAAYIVSCLSMERYVAFSKGHIVYAKDRQKNEAYEWIRDNTPGNSLIILGYTETNWPCCGLNSSYEAAAFSERTLYVVKDEDYIVSNPEFTKRISFRKKLFEDPKDRSVIDHFNSLNRPVFLLIDDSLDRDRFFVEERFDQFPPDLGKEFVPVFQNAKQRVYHIRLNK
jgi:hypothetical protein